MERKYIEYIGMVERVGNYRTAHLDLFPEGSLAAETFNALGAAITKVSNEAASQVSGKNGRRRKSSVRSAARVALRTQIQRISETAAAIALDTPAFADSFRMPAPAGDKALIHAGKSFANEAAAVKEQFLQLHLPPDFIDKLNAAIAKLEGAIIEQASTNIKGASATRSIVETMGECQRLVQRLDAVVKNIIADNALLAAEWENARRVPHIATRSTAAEQPSTTPSPS